MFGLNFVVQNFNVLTLAIAVEDRQKFRKNHFFSSGYPKTNISTKTKLIFSCMHHLFNSVKAVVFTRYESVLQTPEINF